MQLEQICKAVCFDFDGVIVDSMPYHLAAWSRAHRVIFGQELAVDVLNTLVGYSTKAIADRLCDRMGKRAARDKLAVQKMKELTASPESLQLFDGFNQLIKDLDAHTIPWAIVSNSPREFVQSILAAHHVQAPLILGLDDVKRPKPAPDPYLQALRHMKLEYAEHPQALVFEDSVHGIRAGVAAKATVIGISSSRPQEELLGAGAFACFETLLEFFDSRLCRSLGIRAD